MSRSREAVPITSTYFPEYGIHPVKQQKDDYDYIASFPTWGDTIQELKNNFPKKGNIVTPEYATAPDDLNELKDKGAHLIINDRIQQAMEVSKGSNATLHLGTPTFILDANQQPIWHNSVLSIHNGEIESATHKTALLPIEKEIGITTPEKDLRTMKDGAAVLICAELHRLFIRPEQNILAGKDVRKIFASTMWATPAVKNWNSTAIEKAGDEYSYYRQQLEKAVGSYLMNSLGTVDRVIVSDRGKPGLKPYNAVFDKIR